MRRLDAASLAFVQSYGLQEVDYQLEQVRLVGDEPPATAPEGIELIALDGRREELLEAVWPVAEEGASSALCSLPTMPLRLDWYWGSPRFTGVYSWSTASARRSPPGTVRPYHTWYTAALAGCPGDGTVLHRAGSSPRVGRRSGSASGIAARTAIRFETLPSRRPPAQRRAGS